MATPKLNTTTSMNREREFTTRTLNCSRRLRMRDYLKILYSIIIPHTIAVMHPFFSFKKSSQMFFHYKSVFKNVSSTVLVGMVGRVNNYVSIVGDMPAAFPVLVVGTLSPRLPVSFSNGIPSFLIGFGVLMRRSVSTLTRTINMFIFFPLILASITFKRFTTKVAFKFCHNPIIYG